MHKVFILECCSMRLSGGRADCRMLNSVKVAFEFQRVAGKNFVAFRSIPGKGHILTMKDGAIIKYRMYSSSKDRSPVVELEVSNLKNFKSQKVHFIKGEI